MKRISIAVASAFAVLLATALPYPSFAQSVIPLSREGDYDRLTAVVNGVGVKAYYTDETWNVSLSPTTFLFLAENGYISYSDVKGNATLRIKGENVPAMTLVIREMRVGDLVIKDMPAALIRTQTAPMLIGPSAFSLFGAVEKQDDRLLVGEEEAVEGSIPLGDPIDETKKLAQQKLEDGDFQGAADAFSSLYSKGYLNMFTFCQYCLTLALADRYEENISKSREWLSRYQGRSAVSDYWILDSMGDSAMKLERWADADSYYEKAYATECELYNTSEEAISKGEFHDEALGKTLFMRSRAQARLGSPYKSEHYVLLASQLGYAPAVEFCQKYGIK